MATRTIENPVLNSPFQEPLRHFRFDDQGITSDIVSGRRPSSYFVPVPEARRRDGQLAMVAEWTQDRIEENELVERIRERVSVWRRGGYQGVTRTSRRLLEYWQAPDRERRLFFCQVEAAETAIYLLEVASQYGEPWIENQLREFADQWNPGLLRVAFKMATGTGKTVLMAMLIAWQTLNKRASPRDTRFTDTFLVVTPGITIRDRLRVLLPNDPGNYYRERDVVPPELTDGLGSARIHIVNFHQFLRRKTGDASKLAESILRTQHIETPDQMVRRVCRDLGAKRQIIVFNDEAHHCYRVRPSAKKVRLSPDERQEAKQRTEQARVWLAGLQAVQRKLGIKVVYDLSATPFFLRGSGYDEGALFPWVVSDFSLIDAIESGIVKVPRVPVSDDAVVDNQPVFRNLWVNIREQLPRGGPRSARVTGSPILPAQLEAALRTLYRNYKEQFRLWEQSPEAQAHSTPPVFIIVCSNTKVSRLVYNFVAGWEDPRLEGDTPYVHSGQLGLFSNATDGRWSSRPNTILIDSAELDSGEQMSPAFRRDARREIEEFRREYRRRYPGRDAASLTDEDLLREVMNTVGKPGRLGERVRCVVSVSMLTEGWDANTVTHILGVRAFGTQLLCEQVVGRALRRRSYEPDDTGMLEAEYAEIYGVPFAFIPASGSVIDPKPSPLPTRVRALPERAYAELTFPNLTGYRFDLEPQRLTHQFSDKTRLRLSTQDVPTETVVASIVGEDQTHTLDDLRNEREQTVAFRLARYTLEEYFRDEAGHLQMWAFPQLLRISRAWLGECLELKDNTYPQLLLVQALGRRAAELIRLSIESSTDRAERLRPILNHYNPRGSTRHVEFDTTRPTMTTDPNKCHVSHVVADTNTWEQKAAQVLEAMPHVRHYVKNHGLEFRIPYTYDGRERWYYPDFIARIDDGRGSDDPLYLVLEVSGPDLPDKAAKTATASKLWIPAVNNAGAWGRWRFYESKDPWKLQTELGNVIARERLGMASAASPIGVEG